MSAPDTTTPVNSQQKKQGLLKYLDNTIGDEGLRTDVKITLTTETLVKLVVACVAATALSTLTYYTLRGIFKH